MNGPSKAKLFLMSITDDNGNLIANEHDIYNQIENAVKDVNIEDQGQTKELIVQWYNAFTMFSKGPVFSITPTIDGLASSCNAIIQEGQPYKVSLHQMTGENML